MKKDAKMSALRTTSFKHSINTYWVTSREAPDQLWAEEWLSSDALVKKFKMRANEGHPMPAFLTFEDTFQHWAEQYEAKVRATPLATPSVMLYSLHAGVAIFHSHLCVPYA